MGQQLDSLQPPEPPSIQLGNCGTACRHITLISPVGISCKELMDGIIFAIKDGKIKKLQEKIVIILDHDTFLSCNEMMPCNAILKHLSSDSSETELCKGFEWMLKHPDKIVFVIYSLNDFLTLLERKRPLIRPFKRSKCDVILHNILSGNLFTESRIISSLSLLETKELKKIHSSVMPDHCLVLRGMSKDTTVTSVNDVLDEMKKASKALSVATMNNLVSEESMVRLTKQMMSPQGFQIPDKEAKREVLMKSLKKSLIEECAEDRRLELYNNLFEGQEGSIPLIQSTIHEIDVSEVRARSSDVSSLCFVVKNAKRLRILNLRRCDLDDDKISRIANAALESSVKIEEIEIAGNEFGPRGMYQLARLMVHCRTKVFRAWGCGLEAAHIEKLVERTHNSRLQLTEVDVSGNRLGPRGMFQLGIFAKQCKVKSLEANGCEKSTDNTSIQNFVKGLDDAKLESLSLTDLSRESGYSQAVLSLLAKVKKELCLRGWRITENYKAAMLKRLKEMRPQHSLKVYLSHGIELKA